MNSRDSELIRLIGSLSKDGEVVIDGDTMHIVFDIVVHDGGISKSGQELVSTISEAYRTVSRRLGDIERVLFGGAASADAEAGNIKPLVPRSMGNL